MTGSRLRVACTAVAFAVTPHVSAQSSWTLYTIDGEVFAEGGSPIAKAEIRVSAKGGTVLRVLQSDSVGHFVVELTDAPASVRVRAFGFAPKTVDAVPSAASHRAHVSIELESVAAELPGVGVTEEEVDRNKKLAGFRDREATNHFAHFVDGDEIARRKPQFVSEMLRGMGGVTLQSSDKLGNILHLRGCSPLVWVDGVRMPGAQLDEVAPAEDVAGIEIYNSFAGIPSRYFDRTATCGTILVWLRS